MSKSFKEIFIEDIKVFFEPVTKWCDKNPDVINYLRLYGVSIFVGIMIGVMNTGFFGGLILLAIYVSLMAVHDTRFEEVIEEDDGRPTV